MTHRILVTRPAAQAASLEASLLAKGLDPVLVPTVEIDTAPGTAPLTTMLATLEGTAWLVLTSANGAAALLSLLGAHGWHLPGGLRIAAVGPATASVMTAAGIRVDHVPRRYRTVAIAEGLGDVRGQRVVLARADAATDELRVALLERGALVEEISAYRTIEGPALSRDPLRAALHAELAGIAFTSSSTVRGLMRLASPVDRGRARAVPAFCIGPVTARTARQGGFHVAGIAADHTIGGLADAIAAHFSQEHA